MCIKLTRFSFDDYDNMCALSYYHNQIRSLAICHCSRVGHEAMVCTLCLLIFLRIISVAAISNNEWQPALISTPLLNSKLFVSNLLRFIPEKHTFKCIRFKHVTNKSWALKNNYGFSAFSADSILKIVWMNLCILQALLIASSVICIFKS